MCASAQATEFAIDGFPKLSLVHRLLLDVRSGFWYGEIRCRIKSLAGGVRGRKEKKSGKA